MEVHVSIMLDICFAHTAFLLCMADTDWKISYAIVVISRCTHISCVVNSLFKMGWEITPLAPT